MDRAQEALTGLSAGADGDRVFERTIGLEAIVRLKDRPAFPVIGGKITIDPIRDPQWAGQLPLFDVTNFAASVGRVDVAGSHMGTGSVVAPGVILTNRHVLEGIAEEVAGPQGATWVFSFGEPSIDFSDVADGSSRFRILRVIDAANEPTLGVVNFAILDAVLLEVEREAGGRVLPPPLSLADASNVAGQKADIVTIGYPARPSAASMRDPATGDFRPDVMARLQEIFGLRYGKKYLAPGSIDLPVGKPTGDAAAWVFAHEATTLGGNSGSPVAALGELAIHGLHFAGATLVGNYAHSLKAVRASGRLPKLETIGAMWI
jgi:hypothetical protein